MLVAMLALVVMAMRQLGQPRTAERLGQIFGQEAKTSHDQTPLDQSSRPREDVSLNKTFRLPRDIVEAEQPLAQAKDFEAQLSQIRDNTYFRPDERGAWFALFGRLQKMGHDELTDASLGERSYAQLLQQPDVYRGRLVTIRGTVVRENLQQPIKNSLGIDSYHQLWIQPKGGGRSPLVVYCLELPQEFPRGDRLRCAVSVTGFFFKNWSYSWDEGLGLAPVVLASRVGWQKPVPRPVRRPVARATLVLAGVGAAIVGLSAAWMAIHYTRRRPRRASSLVSLPVGTAGEEDDE